MHFKDIPKFTRGARYQIDISWKYLPAYLQSLKEDYRLNLAPDFQREHVWSPRQQQAYIEYALAGGLTGKDIYFNYPNYNLNAMQDTDSMVIVDGKQRVEAVMAFLRDEIIVFGHRLCDFEGEFRANLCTLKVGINDLETKAEVLSWYLAINATGTPHTPKEIERVRAMLKQEQKGDA